ncbi:hypothetical protein CkaCkLH20_08924 [Colletotrichum karsti]|uniref:Peroxidase n=1 Tax=Colletotrichum karsti TaxID=1095194 RepID=A0A9P6LIA4_9PEZI|nr:uncharacterized protein CkaCkLH20_08924 [Colletotrichum karsti]KAF9873465.1 hypothetical protein CkaCkLH20_08924 [Colletotrichum karsti]
MRYSNMIVAAFAAGSSAYPGWSNNGFMDSLYARAGAISDEPLGDLASLGDSSLSPTGKTLKNILTTSASAISTDKYNGNVPALGSKECAADKCCVWKHVGDEMATMFRDGSGCTPPARAAVRLGFHDASGWSKATGPLGGADGSIVLAPEEIKRALNDGLQDAVTQTQTWFNKYKQFGVGMADLIQFAANTGTVMCPMGPRITTLIGRKDSSKACPDGLLPDVNDPVDKLIGLFANKTISAPGLAALVGAHTASTQKTVDRARAGAPQDTTPGVWDTLFYSQTLAGAPSQVFTFNSDKVLSKDSRSGPAFQAFANNQPVWNGAFAREYLRLSLLGVDNINDLTDCTKSLPVPN